MFLATKVSPDNLAREDVLEHARASLDRLGVERVDLLYVHWPTGAYDPGETLPALDELHEAGLVRNVGLSNFTPDLLTEAVDRLDAPLYAHQVECHPLLPQDALRALADEHGHHLVAHSSLAKGQVTDVAALRAVADEHGATAAQVGLAWLRAKGAVPIPKSGTPTHIEENLAAADLELTDDDVARIDAVERRERTVDFPEAPWN